MLSEMVVDTLDDKLYKLGKNKLIELSLQLFHVFGMWPKENSTIVYTLVGYIFQVLTSLAWTVAKSIATVMLEKRTELILFVPTTVYAYTFISRGFLIMWNHKTIDSSLKSMSDLPLTKSEYETIQRKMNFFNRTSIFYTTFISFSLVSACLNPLISNGKELPVPIWLPYNDWKRNRPDYYFALIFSYVAIAPITVLCSLTPIIVWYLLLINSIKLEILGNKLRILGRKETKPNDSIMDLLSCVRRHQEIVRNIQVVKDTFESVFLYQIISSAICICSIAYLLADSLTVDSNSFMMYVGLGGIYIYEIFVLIYYANEITLASDQLSFNLYESNWTSKTMKYQKIMIIMVEKWKKPQELIVGKVFSMRINILTSILNVAYSILNVLRKGRP